MADGRKVGEILNADGETGKRKLYLRFCRKCQNLSTFPRRVVNRMVHVSLRLTNF